MRSRRTLGLLVSLGIVVASAGKANAQTAAPLVPDGGFAVNKFEPSERGSEWFILDSLDYRGRFRPAIGAVAEYAYRPLVIYDKDDRVQNSVVRNQFITHIGASVVLFERLRLSASLPVGLYLDGRGGVLRSTYFPSPPNEQALGDLRFALDGRVYGEADGRIRLGAGLRFWAPTGSRVNYMSDGAVRVQPHLNVAGDIGPFVYAASGGLTVRTADIATFADSAIGTELNVYGAIGAKVLDRRLTFGPEITFSTALNDLPSGSGGGLSRRSTPVEGLLGAHYVAGPVRFGLGAGTGLSRGAGAPQARVVGSIEWQPEVVREEDRDHDGIRDAEDACPYVAGERNDDPRKHGCPAEVAAKDSDGDGFVDALDACVDVPGIKTDDPKTTGCPSDRDNDGIYDKDDACLDVAGVRSADRLKNGCPLDSDGDGVIDAVDACPDRPGPSSNDPKTNGCPDADRDKDGVPNDQDACPDEPGPAATDPKRNGCPKAFVKEGKIQILDQVRFKTASTVIERDRATDEVLAAVLKVLTEHKEIAHVSIEGHTDNRGVAASNKRLSEGRATAVMAWLVGHGVAKDRLRASGFGQERPVETNDTDAGRQKNRRVEFKIEGSGK